jgi:pimeloyl-ACP methyl ester carboxylesterase
MSDQPVHVVADGAGDPPVLVSAGLGDAWFTWDRVAALLASRHLVVRFDRPGLGESPLRAALPTLRGEAERIHRLVTALGLRRPVVVAHSAAGLHAEAYARLHPDGPSALVLVDPSAEPPWRPIPRLPGAVVPSLRTLAEVADPAARVAGPAVWARIVRHLSPVRPDDTAAAARVYGSGAVAAAAFGEWFAHGGMVRDLVDLRASTSPPRVPVVVLTALGDLRTARARARWRRAHARLASAFPHGRQEVIRDSGHLVHLDRPEAIAAAVARP